MDFVVFLARCEGGRFGARDGGFRLGVAGLYEVDLEFLSVEAIGFN
jgi:hypothetical protein